MSTDHTPSDPPSRYLDEVFRPGARLLPLALDVSQPAVRAILRLFLEIKTAENHWLTEPTPRGGRDLQDVVEAWFTGIGLTLDQSATSLVLGLIRGWRDPGIDVTTEQTCYGRDCYGEGCCEQNSGTISEPEPEPEPEPEAEAEAESVPVALALYGDRCSGGPAEPTDPDVLTEVAADLMGDIFDLARQAGLEPDRLVGRALRLLTSRAPSGGPRPPSSGGPPGPLRRTR
ncbi:hypothetical protein ACL02T_10785 [Pseudonocardia sp. RS010]|uniref:hypothetical protein n=1 Tax=Pseudonocardia sp. RS010 TaxID=3385979 RepID=UPI0039A0414E